MRSRIVSPRSETTLRKQDMRSLARPAEKTQAQFEAEYTANLIKTNVSTLQTEKDKTKQTLDKLTQTRDALIKRLDKEGRLDTQTVRGINADYRDKRKDVVSKIRGLSSAITEAKKGAFTIESLKQHASNVEGYAEQKMNVQQQMQKEMQKASDLKTVQAGRLPEIITQTAIGAKVITGKSLRAKNAATFSSIGKPNVPAIFDVTKGAAESERKINVYKDLGYTTKESMKLAAEGERRQQTLTVKGADQFLNKESGKKVDQKATGTTLLTTDVDELSRQYRQATRAEEKLERLNKKMETLKKGNINQDNMWTGSEADYKKYENLATEYDKAIKVYEGSTVKVGFGTATVDKHITEFKWLGAKSELSKRVQGFGDIIGASYGAGLTETGKAVGSLFSTQGKGRTGIIKEEDIKRTPEKVVITKGMTGSVIGFGTQDPKYEVDVLKYEAAKKEVKSGKWDVAATGAVVGGKVLGFVGEISPYLNPLGGYLYGAEQAARLQQNIQEEGGVAKGAKDWFIEAPIESTIAIALPILKGAKIGASKLKLTKSSRYLSKPVAKEIIFSQRKVISKTTEKAKGISLNLLEEAGKAKPKIRVKLKAVTKKVKYTPKGDYVGKVQEVRFVPSFKSFIKGKGFFVKKTFTGEAILTEAGLLKETIQYGKKIRKVSVSTAKKGGVTELFEYGERIKRAKILPSKQQFIKQKPVKQRIDIDEQFGQKGKTIKEKIIIDAAEGKKVKMIKTDKTGVGDLTAKRVKGEFKQTTRIKQSLTGETIKQKDVSGYLETVKAEPRKAMIQLRSGKQTKILKQKVGQSIEYGKPKRLDKTVRQVTDRGSLTAREISPKTLTKSERGAETIIEYQFVNPKYKGKKGLKDIFKTEKKPAAIEDVKLNIKKYKKQISLKEPKIAKAPKPTPTPSQPSYIDMGSQRQSQVLTPELRLPAIEEVVVVAAPERLIAKKLSKQVDVPNIYGVAEKSKVGLGVHIRDADIQTYETGLNYLPAIKEKSLMGQDSVQKTFQETRQTMKVEQEPASRYIQKVAQSLETKQMQKQVQTQVQTQTPFQKQLQKQRQRTQPTEATTTPTPTIPLGFGLGKAVKQLKRKAKEGGAFEAVGIRFGQEVSLARGTQQEVTTKLSKFLTTTLGASGFLKTDERKLKARETGLLSQAGFRASTVDPFKVVEKKARRLKKGRTGETQEIQMFKKTGKKSKKTKSLFGI